ncbi:hypothetical protein WR25_20632 isoform C [Diploscapter pachys]|uniref:Uncharacterized protein n=1 Tax=Diploscapter pachys TaxID=2018661 RepID=A0A2A2KZR2_9BILA|nr:hypothetical protein WR25_20632 isoform C [Diploscapter pachys]
MIPCIKVTNGARGRYIVKTFSGGSNQNGVPVVKIPANNKIGVRYTAKGDPPNLTLADVLPQLQTRRSIIPSQEQTIRVVKRNVSPSDIILVGSNTTYVNKPLVIRKITPATPAETKQVTATRPVIRSITRQAPSQNQGPSLSKSGTGSFIPPSKLTEQAEKEIKKEPLAGGNEFDFEESFTPRASTSTTSHPRRSPSPCFDQSVGRRPLPQIIREIEKPSEIRVLRRQLRIKPLERNSNSNESTARFQPYPHIMPGGKFVTRKIRVFQSNDQATGPKLNFTELLRGHITPSQKSSSTSNSNPNHQPPECSSSASFTPVPNSISNVQIVGAQEYGKKLMTNFVDKNDGTVEHWLVVERVVNSLDEVQGHSTIEKQAMLEVIINTLCSKGNYSVNARAQDMRLNGIYDEPKVAVMNKIVHTIRRSFTSNIQCNILGRVRLPTTDDPIPQIYVVRSPLKQSHYLIIHFIEKCIWELELMGNQECVFKFERLINAMYELIVAIWDIDVVVKKYALRGDPAFCLLYNTLFDIKSPRGKLQAVLQECDPEVAQEFATKPFRLVPNYRLVKDKFPVCKQQTPFVTAIASLIKMRLGQQVNRSLFRIVKHHGTKGYFTKLFSELLTYFRLDKNGQGVMSIACTEHLLEHKLISQIAMEHQLDFVKLELVLGLVGKFVLDIQKTNPESSNYTLRIYEIRSEYTFQNAHTGFLDSPIASQLCQVNYEGYS